MFIHITYRVLLIVYVADDEEIRDNFEKRHIGSLARLGLLPSFRFSGGRYSRSGRARLLLPSQEMYRSCKKLPFDWCDSVRKWIRALVLQREKCIVSDNVRRMISVSGYCLRLVFRENCPVR